MKKILLVIVVQLSFFAVVFPQKVEIESLKIYKAGEETSFPVITIDSSKIDYLTIEFDIQSEFIPDLNIVFRFCDKNWRPYTNLFLLNQGKNVAYNLQLENLPTTIRHARYHYKSNFPDSDGYVSFPFSGKWICYITDAYDTSIVYATGRFYVVAKELELGVTLKKELLEDKVYFPMDLAKVFNITANFNLPKSLYPSYVNEMEIIENQKLEYPIIIGRSFNTNTRQYYWNGDRKFSFTARDILPGNEYREVDIRDINKFSSENVRAQFDGLEYSRFYIQGKRDLNGGDILMNFKNINATYLNVTFSIRPPDGVKGSIFLVGAFNNWRLQPDYEMTDNYGVYSKTILLKRGVYDYQYVTADLINGQIKNADWDILEGNSWDTSNEYHLFLYYTDPNYGGYDRIISYQKIESK